jgi:molybdopterin/thiamine biosynthesis adenylyltransferase
VREKARDEERVIVVDLLVPGPNPPLRLHAVFPDFYPYLKPQVYGPPHTFARHQNPFTGALCLLGRWTGNWSPGDDTLAGILETQLPELIRANAVPDPIEAGIREEPQGEPFSDYYPKTAQSVCLVDGAWDLGAVTQGQATVKFSEVADGIRVLVLQLRDPDGRTLVSLADEIQAAEPGTIGAGRWVRLEQPIPVSDADEFNRALVRAVKRLGVRQAVGKHEFILVGFPEETQYRTWRQGWILLLRQFRPGANPRCHLVRVSRAGEGDMAARVPETQALRRATVTIVGAGCVGAPIAVELARAQLRTLRIVDTDVVETGTIVRWPLGLPAVGQFKVRALADFIKRHYPGTKVEPYQHFIGTATADPADRGESDMDVLNRLLDGADVLVDATAERGIQRLLSDVCLERQVPCVCAHGTQGGWGGQVVRFVKGRTGCWRCLELLQDDQTILYPPQDPASFVQPTGCADPTFVGAAFDLTEISLATARMVVSTLRRLDLTWDVQILRLRDDRGRPIPGTWDGYRLVHHPGCRQCAAQ